MDFLFYNEKYTVVPSGFQNTGVICYFNSLLQSLLSCTALNQYMINTPINYTNKLGQPTTKNIVWKTYQDMIKGMLTTPNSKWSVIMWEVLINYLKKNNKHENFGKGQEDAHEGLVILLDAMNDKNIDRLFDHRFRTTIKCNFCDKVCSITMDESTVIDVYPEELDEKNSLEQYIKKYNPIMDENYICSHKDCMKRGNKNQERNITMLPEIIILQFKKYNNKTLVKFPEQIDFSSINNKNIIYKLVSQIEHSGNKNGGHYWSISLREHEKIYNFNDTSIIDAVWNPTNNTYMAFYHII